MGGAQGGGAKERVPIEVWGPSMRVPIKGGVPTGGGLVGVPMGGGGRSIGVPIEVWGPRVGVPIKGGVPMGGLIVGVSLLGSRGGSPNGGGVLNVGVPIKEGDPMGRVSL